MNIYSNQWSWCELPDPMCPAWFWPFLTPCRPATDAELQATVTNKRCSATSVSWEVLEFGLGAAWPTAKKIQFPRSHRERRWKASTFKEHRGSKSNTCDMPIESCGPVGRISFCLVPCSFTPIHKPSQFCLVGWKDFASRASSRMA